MITIPGRIIKDLPKLADKIERSFKRKIKGIKYLGFVDLSDDSHPQRYVGVIATEICDAGGENDPTTLAAYCQEMDVIYIFRSITDSKHGPTGIQHYLCHEIAHAIDRDNIAKDEEIDMRAADWQSKYACSRAEFSAEWAAIQTVDIPSGSLNYSSGFVGNWIENPDAKKKFFDRLERLKTAIAA
jgi:hypothetical protein